MGLSALQKSHLVLGFQTGMKDRPTPFYSRLVRTIPNLTNRDQYEIAAHSGATRPVRDAARVKYSRVSAWKHAITHKPWKQGLEITDADVANDTLGVLTGIPASMPGLWILSYEDQCVDMLDKGHLTTYGLAFTGKRLFAADHKYPKGIPNQTAWSNNVTKTECPGLQVASTPTNPTPDEWHAAIASIRKHLVQKVLSENSERLFYGREPLRLYIPAGVMETNAQEAFFESVIVNGKANIGLKQGIQELVIDPGLETSLATFFVQVIVPGFEAPLIHPWWQMPKSKGHYEHKMTATGSVADVDEDTTRWKVSAEEDINVGDPRTMIRATFAT